MEEFKAYSVFEKAVQQANICLKIKFVDQVLDSRTGLAGRFKINSQ